MHGGKREFDQREFNISVQTTELFLNGDAMSTRQMWSITVSHTGLGKTRVISGSNKFVVEEKAAAQRLDWESAWQAKQATAWEKEQKDAQREDALRSKLRSKADALAYKASRAEEAQDRTTQAQAALTALQSILTHTLAINDIVQWAQLKQSDKFKEPKPPSQLANLSGPKYQTVESRPDRTDPEFEAKFVAAAQLPARPRRPQLEDPAFKPALSFFVGLFTSGTRKREMRAAAHQTAVSSWSETCAAINLANTQALATRFEKLDMAWRDKKRLCDAANDLENSRYETATQEAVAADKIALDHWESRKLAFDDKQKDHNLTIDLQKSAYENQDSGAVCDYFDLVLTASAYPDFFARDWELDYLSDSRVLVVNFTLINPQQIPTLKEVKYLSSKDEFKEVHLSERECQALYDSVLYQTALRTVHELFESDYAKTLDAVVFNGFVNGVDKASGHAFTACVMSVQASKEEFMAINLAHIDPKACFKKLKGVGSSQLHGLAPVAPILQLDRSDSRFVDSYAVAGGLDESTNLAAMDWEDFEHLVRELFEKEFLSTGGEVRITQASRDGGVDAVAFDPDPIRGGKIVIQAKRYSNVVGVSAVRDLYGTVMNEGAIKGILVTTADYGPDSYEFIKGKPLTLLNGSNLLHLLAKHGHKASIDIRAARAVQ